MVRFPGGGRWMLLCVCTKQKEGLHGPLLGYSNALLCQDFLFSGEDVVGEDFGVDFLEAHTGNGIGEALAGETQLLIAENGLFHGGENLFHDKL